jgi:nitrogenase molybdenum-iron protein NifN
MAAVLPSAKACTVNPLKLSMPLGGATAFMGLDGCLPMLHGAQGCTAFGLVLLVRHFREAVPFQTTAMNEVTTILGGLDNLEQAILNIAERAHPKVIGICSNGLIEARGEDIAGDLKLIRGRHPELADTALIYASTPDYKGAFQDGWSAAVTATVEALVEERPAGRTLRQINILAGCHLTPADLEEIHDTAEAFGLAPIILPDLSGSLDGHVAGEFVPTTLGGTGVDDIRRMGRSVLTLALGLQMEPAARLIEARCGVPVEIFPRLTGLLAWDEFIAALARVSGRPVPQAIRRRRSQLLDAMLDGHFFFGGKRIGIAAEPDLLLNLSQFLADMGARIACAVTTTDSPALARVPAETVTIGDLDDLERLAGDCDLIVSHSHGRRVAERLGITFFGAGFPVFDRLGAAQRLSVGYRGTRDLIFEIGNLFMAGQGGHGARDRQGGSHAAIASH